MGVAAAGGSPGPVPGPRGGDQHPAGSTGAGQTTADQEYTR